MAPSAISRVPAELWHDIIRMVVHGLEYFNPDPYDVPPERLLRTYRLLDELRQEFKAQILILQRVSKSWNHFAGSLIHDAISLAPTEDRLQPIQMARAIRIIVTPFFVSCQCWLGDPCPACVQRRGQRGNFDDLLSASKGLWVEILDDANREFLSALETSKIDIPHLRSLQIEPNLPCSGPQVHLITQRFNSLISLDFEWDSTSASQYEGLSMFNLVSLRISGDHGEFFSMENWTMPRLTSLMLEFRVSSVEEILLRIVEFGRNLKFFSLSEWCRFDPAQATTLWTTCPKIIAFSTPVKFLLAHPPPPDHPAQYFRADDEDIEDMPNEPVACNLLTIVKQWPKCRGIMGWFKWKLDFENVHSLVIPGSRMDNLVLLRSRYERLRVGAELDALGVRYEDSFGISYSEACVKFGGSNVEESIVKFQEFAKARSVLPI